MLLADITLTATAARMQAIDPSGNYDLASDYTASLTQAGRFMNAFGGALTYDSPNVMASPTRVVDAPSGMVYASFDGADDTAIGSAPQKVAVYTALFRKPESPSKDYGAIIARSSPDSGASRELFFPANTFIAGVVDARQNGVDKGGGNPDIGPLNHWMVLTVQRQDLFEIVFQIAGSDGHNVGTLHLAALRTWPAVPTPAVVAATEQEMMTYFGPLLATNPA